MVNSYADPIPNGEFNKKNPRYTFRKDYCAWCGRHLWLAEEGICGYCYEDPTRLEVESRNNRILRLAQTRRKQ